MQGCSGGCLNSLSTEPETGNEAYGPHEFIGVIDEMRIWDRKRSLEEIVKGMKADQDRGAGVDSEDYEQNDSHLVAHWKFDEGSGLIVKDSTGNGHDLLMQRDPSWKVGERSLFGSMRGC